MGWDAPDAGFVMCAETFFVDKQVSDPPPPLPPPCCATRCAPSPQGAATYARLNGRCGHRAKYVAAYHVLYSLSNFPSSQAKAEAGTHTETVSTMAIAPDGSALLTGGFDSMVKLWCAPGA